MSRFFGLHEPSVSHSGYFQGVAFLHAFRKQSAELNSVVHTYSAENLIRYRVACAARKVRASQAKARQG
jgi:hypothetical protein